VAGAAYLIYLGLRAIVSALRTSEPARHTRPARRGAFLQGLLSDLSNAKMVAFFIGLLPPFAGPHPTFVLLLALGLNFCGLTLAWLTAYAFAVERVSGFLRQNAVRRTLDAVVGSVLIALGVRVGTEALASS
jgi:threonine/homoserine/homoserine lactone efflux protein